MNWLYLRIKLRVESRFNSNRVLFTLNPLLLADPTSKFRSTFKIFAHVVLWVGVLMYLVVLQSGEAGYFSVLPRNIISTILLIILFYYNSLFLIPKFLAEKKVALYVAFVLAGILVVAAINIGNHYIFDSMIELQDWQLKHQIYDSLFLMLLVWGISTVSRITTEWFRNEIMRKEAEKRQVSAELAFLKSQINPHFLFNTLNNIYALCHRNNNSDSAEAVAKLSGLMRYMLFGSVTPTVKLKDEIEYLRNYLDLQKMRINKNIEVNFVVNGDCENFEIAPLLLIPFVENAFKYGLSYVAESFIRIECTVTDHQLKFTVQNTIHERGKNDLSSGIGLENVRRRLELLYPGKHAMHIKEADSVFNVELVVNN